MEPRALTVEQACRIRLQLTLAQEESPTGMLSSFYEVAMLLSMVFSDGLKHGLVGDETNIEATNYDEFTREWLLRISEQEESILLVEKRGYLSSWYWRAYKRALQQLNPAARIRNLNFVNVVKLSNENPFYLWERAAIINDMQMKILGDEVPLKPNSTGAKIALQFKQAFLATRKTYSLNQTAGTEDDDNMFSAHCSIQPIFVVLNFGDLHFSLLAAIDNFWYHYDSIPSYGHDKRVLEWFKTVYRKCNIDIKEPRIKFMDQSDALPTHMSIKQPNGIDCLLHVIAKIDYFLRTNFQTWPSISTRVGVDIYNEIIQDMRRDCVQFYRLIQRAAPALEKEVRKLAKLV